MKKTLTLILALALCLLLAVPAFAQEGYAPVTLSDGTGSVVFSQGKQQDKAILLSRQIWSEEAKTVITTAAERTEIKLIVVRTNSTITRTVNDKPVTLSFLTRSGNSYVLTRDRLELYFGSVSADKLFAYPFENAELIRVTLDDGAEYYLISGATALKEAPPVPIDYIVQPGDDIENIALNYYGATGLGDALKAANTAHYEAAEGILEAGRALTLPVTLNGHARLSEPLLREGETFHIVKYGDTLSGISLKYYGNANDYNQIFERNRDRMKTIGNLMVGQILVIPVLSA